MNKLTIKKASILLTHVFVGWALCTATMGISMAITTEQNALIIHAAAAPVIAVAVSLIYFGKFNYTTPLQTAFAFVGFIICMDFFVVALIALKSLEMFTSFIGTWLPFILIFASTYLTSLHVTRKKPAPAT